MVSYTQNDPALAQYAANPDAFLGGLGGQDERSGAPEVQPYGTDLTDYEPPVQQDLTTTDTGTTGRRSAAGVPLGPGEPGAGTVGPGGYYVTNPNGTEGGGRPLSPTERQQNPTFAGGSFINPLGAESQTYNAETRYGTAPGAGPAPLTIEQQALQGVTPTRAGGLPAPGRTDTGTTATTTGARQLSNQEWQDAFQKAMGYYSNQYENRKDFLENALMGDQVIRGRSAGGPQID